MKSGSEKAPHLILPWWLSVPIVEIFRADASKHIFLYFVPGLLKRQNLKFLFIFSSQTLITCFGWRPDHMVFDSQLTKIIQRSQETGPYFHFLSETLRESESREKWVLNFIPSGVSVLSHFPSPPLSSNPSLLKNTPPVSTGARTPPSNCDCLHPNPSNWHQEQVGSL